MKPGYPADDAFSFEGLYENDIRALKTLYPGMTTSKDINDEPRE